MWATLLTPAALAATYTVHQDGSGDFDSIKAAIEASADGDVIEVGPGTYSQGLDLRNVDVTILGVDGSAATIIDGGGFPEQLVWLGGVDSLSGFTLRNSGSGGVTGTYATFTGEDLVFEDLGASGAYGGAVSLQNSTASLTTAVFTGNQGYAGGAVYTALTTLDCTDCTFADNHAGLGAGLYADGGVLTLSGSVFDDNGDEVWEDTSVHGGGIYLVNAAQLTATDAVFTDNDASYGGGLFTAYEVLVTLVDSTIYSNSAFYAGGAWVGPDSLLTLERTTVESNGHTDYATAYTQGGGVFLDQGDLAAIDSAFVRNFGYYGGGLYASSAGEVVLSGTTFEQQVAYYGGAGYLYYTALLDVTDGLFDTNTGYYGGGALYNYVVTDSRFSGTTFQENQALYGVGGAMYQYYPTSWSSEGSTYASNLGAYAGGAVYLYYLAGPASSTGDVFTSNEATYSGGGAIWAYYQAFAEGDMIIADGEFTWNTSYQGGAIYTSTMDLVLSDLEVRGNAATLYGGGGIWADYGDLSLTDATVTDNTAATEGGGVAHRDGDRLVLSQVVVADNDAGGAGGGAYVKAIARSNVHNATLAGNSAKYGGGLYQADCAGGNMHWTNVRYQDNSARYGGGLALVESETTSLENVSVVANQAVDAGAAIYLYESPLRLWNSVVAFHEDDLAAVYAEDDTSAASEFVNNLFYGNPTGQGAGTLADLAPHLVTHPLLAFSDDGDWSDDALGPLVDSPLIDAGSDQILDVDEGPSDIGWTGGPYMALVDRDLDGWDNNLDCHDDDGDAHPGGTEIWYDGINGDCSGLSDFDQDGDGHDAEEHGGDDCDDLEPRAWKHCPGEDGPASTDDDEGTEGGTCSSVPGRAAGLWVLAALVGLVRAGRGRHADSGD